MDSDKKPEESNKLLRRACLGLKHLRVKEVVEEGRQQAVLRESPLPHMRHKQGADEVKLKRRAREEIARDAAREGQRDVARFASRVDQVVAEIFPANACRVSMLGRRPYCLENSNLNSPYEARAAVFGPVLGAWEVDGGLEHMSVDDVERVRDGLHVGRDEGLPGPCGAHLPQTAEGRERMHVGLGKPVGAEVLARGAAHVRGEAGERAHAVVTLVEGEALERHQQPCVRGAHELREGRRRDGVDIDLWGDEINKINASELQELLNPQPYHFWNRYALTSWNSPVDEREPLAGLPPARDDDLAPMDCDGVRG